MDSTQPQTTTPSTEKKVNGTAVTDQQLQEMKNDPNIRLKETAPGEFKKLEKMHG